MTMSTISGTVVLMWMWMMTKRTETRTNGWKMNSQTIEIIPRQIRNVLPAVRRNIHNPLSTIVVKAIIIGHDRPQLVRYIVKRHPIVSTTTVLPLLAHRPAPHCPLLPRVVTEVGSRSPHHHPPAVILHQRKANAATLKKSLSQSVPQVGTSSRRRKTCSIGCLFALRE
uniref:Putative secreted protein n=1 Tax=Anopheles darlingi TaxID=43151 RepID=A0A2M4DFC5_ANODA